MKKAVAFLLSLALAVPCNADVLISQSFVIVTPDSFERVKSFETSTEATKNYVYQASWNEYIILLFSDFSDGIDSILGTESFQTHFFFKGMSFLSEEEKTTSSGLTVSVRKYDDEERDFKYLNTSLVENGISIDIYCMFPRTLDEPQCIDDYNAMIDTLARLDLLPPKQAFEYLDAMVTD